MILGFLISLVIVALMAVCLSGTNKNWNVVSCCIAVALFVASSIMTNKTIEVIRIKSNMSDYILSVQTMLDSYGWFDEEGTVSPQEAATIALSLKTSYPAMSKAFRVSDFVNIPYNQVLQTVSNDISKGINKTLWNRIGWTLFIWLVGTFLVYLTMEKKVSRRGNARSHSKSRRHTHRHR